MTGRANEQEVRSHVHPRFHFNQGVDTSALRSHAMRLFILFGTKEMVLLALPAVPSLNADRGRARITQRGEKKKGDDGTVEGTQKRERWAREARGRASGITHRATQDLMHRALSSFPLRSLRRSGWATFFVTGQEDEVSGGHDYPGYPNQTQTNKYCSVNRAAHDAYACHANLAFALTHVDGRRQPASQHDDARCLINNKSHHSIRSHHRLVINIHPAAFVQNFKYR